MIRNSLCLLPLKTLNRWTPNEIVHGRTLYTKAALGLDAYEYSRSKYRDQVGRDEEAFRNKMKTVVENERNAVFTDDLKVMLHLAQTDDIPLVKDMVSKFENQSSQLRFGNFIFGPVVMRLFYHFNKHEDALELFKASKGFLDQVVSFQLLMDLLFNNERYSEVLEVFDLVKEKQIQGAKYPRNLVVLTLGACYKLNTPESFEYAANLWSDLMKVGHRPMRRAATFFAALALRQGKADVALEVLSTVQKSSYVTVRNLKTCALSQVGRLDEAVHTLQEMLAWEGESRMQTISDDTVNMVKQAVEKSGNMALSEQLSKIESKLRSLNQIDEKSLDSWLCAEIDKIPQDIREGFQFEGGRQRDQQRYQRPSFNYKSPRFRSHPGLSEMT